MRVCLLLVLALSGPVGAETFLVLEPAVAQVQAITYGQADLTLLTEQRRIPLLAGRSKLEFSWQGMAIDPTSVRIKLPTPLSLVTTIFPPARPTTVQWEVEAPQAGTYEVEISYNLAGLTWSPCYTLTYDEQTGTATLTGEVELKNATGRDLPDLKVTLAVGDVRLVKEPRKAAAVKLTDDVLGAARARATAPAVPKRTVPAGGADLGRKLFGGLAGPPRIPGQQLQPPRVPRLPRTDLLQQYLYELPGRLELRHKWVKRLPWIGPVTVTPQEVLRIAPQQHGLVARRILVWADEDRAALSPGPLPAGSVTLVSQDRSLGPVPLGTAKLAHAPAGEKLELDLGVDSHLVVQRDLIGYKTTDIVFDGNLRVAGFDTHERYRVQVRSTAPRELAVEVVETIPGVWELSSRDKFERRELNEVAFCFSLKPGQTKMLEYKITRHHGKRAIE